MGVALLFGITASFSSLRADAAAPRRWVASASILAAHVQSTAILSASCRVWPTSVERALACSLFAYGCIADPECLTADPTRGLAAHLDTLQSATRLHALALLVCYLPAVGAAVMGPMFGLRTCRTLFGPLAFLGGALSTLLPAAAMRASVTLCHVGEWPLAIGLLAPLLLLLLKVLVELEVASRRRWSRQHLAPGLAFFTRRFASHAPYWQLVQWATHALLMTFSLTATASRAWGYEAAQLHSSTEPLRLMARVGASLTLLGSWSLHVLVEPYEYSHQNALASWLHAPQFAALWIGFTFEQLYSTFDRGNGCGTSLTLARTLTQPFSFDLGIG